VDLFLAVAFSAALFQTPGPCEQGRSLFLAKSYQDAQEPLWRCVLAGTPNKEWAHELALTYRDLKNYDAGLARARSALKEQPRSVDVLYLIGFLQFRQGNCRESVETLERAYHLDPSDWRVHQVFALNYVVLDIKPGALAEFQTAIALNPANAEMHYQLARFYFSDNRPQESIDESKRALALFPDYAEAYDNLGLCYQALADTEKATDAFQRSVDLSRKYGVKDEWPFLNYANYLIKLGNAEKSLPVLEQAIAVNPRSAKAHYYLGRAMWRLNRNAEAKRYLEESIQLDANDPGPYYELGTLLARDGDWAHAKPLFERFEALRKQPENGRNEGSK
jgi:protein O-GlcNAc transferase